MEITAILDAVKGKILDAANFTLLQAAYELQAQNIEQLCEPDRSWRLPAPPEARESAAAALHRGWRA